MANLPIINFKKLTRQQALVGLLVVVALGSLAYWKNSTNPPAALESSADEYPAPHWPHRTTPAPINFINNGSAKWDSILANSLQNWESNGAIDFNVTPGSDSEVCNLYPEAINFCNVNDSNAGIAYGAQVYWIRTGHYITAGFVFNNYYFLNSKFREYSSSEFKNYMFCFYSGVLIGSPWRYNEGPNTTSCMNPAWDVPFSQMQSPDKIDYRNLKELYSHFDDTSSTSISYKVNLANNAFQKKQFGKMSKSLSSDKQLVYELDLGDGFVMKTTVFVAPKPLTNTKK